MIEVVRRLHNQAPGAVIASFPDEVGVEVFIDKTARVDAAAMRTLYGAGAVEVTRSTYPSAGTLIYARSVTARMGSNIVASSAIWANLRP